MDKFFIDDNKCLKCGKCSLICPVGIIQRTNSDTLFVAPEMKDKCIKCQHCIMFCPTSAISIDDIYPSKASVIDYLRLPKFEDLDLLIKARRSVRVFKDENIPKEYLVKLLSSSLNAPTGVNKNNVLFTVISDKDKMNSFRKKVMDQLVIDSEKNMLPPELNFFNEIARTWKEKNIDIVFRNAPHMVIASVPRDNRTPEADCIIALSYLDLLAPTLGYGTLWCGFAKYMITLIVPEALDELNIPLDHKVGYVMLLGKPAFRYKITPQRKIELNIID